MLVRNGLTHARYLYLWNATERAQPYLQLYEYPLVCLVAVRMHARHLQLPVGCRLYVRGIALLRCM